MTKHRDILKSRATFVLVYGIPIMALVATGLLDADLFITGIVWAASLGVMGGGCLWNAWRCGRIHCYFTGPFFLFIGLLALLQGLSVFSVGDTAWMWLGGLLLFGGMGLNIIHGLDPVSWTG